MRAARVCLIVDPMHESIFQLLTEIGWKIDYQPDITREQIRKILHQYQGLIIRSKTRVDQDLLGESTTLRFVGRAGAGLDNLDQEYLREKGVSVIHAAEGNRDAVGEFTMGLLLAVMRNIPRSDAEVRGLQWRREANRGEELAGKTVSIIGYGNMGTAFAQRLSGFGCKILVYDKYKSGFGNNFCVESSMDRVFEESDILSLHIPLTAETRGMAEERYFERFRKNIILINTARGEIVPLRALVNGLKNGKLRAAGLDVLEDEKINQLGEKQLQYFNYLASQSNVIFTPHIAGWTYESHLKINVALVKKIKELIF